MERLWTKPYIQMMVAMLFLFTALYLLLPTLPLFIKQLGGSESQVGLAAALLLARSRQLAVRTGHRHPPDLPRPQDPAGLS